MDYVSVQRQLRQAAGIAYWRSLQAREKKRPYGQGRFPPNDQFHVYKDSLGRVEEIG